MNRAIQLAVDNVLGAKGGPFGAVILNKNLEVIGVGQNSVTRTNDPTAHAEVCAIRDACNKTGSYILKDCIIYSSCEPCPMCLGAIYWSRMNKLVFAANRKTAEDGGFSDAFIYDEFAKDHSEKSIVIKEMNL